LSGEVLPKPQSWDEAKMDMQSHMRKRARDSTYGRGLDALDAINLFDGRASLTRWRKQIPGHCNVNRASIKMWDLAA